MRAIVWFTLLFVVAVVAATTLGSNDGLVSFYWSGWRTDISLNMFLLALALTCFALVTMIRAVDTLAGLPRRSREWRSARSDRIAQAALREALAQYFGGRWGRARKAAQQAIATRSDAAGVGQDAEFNALGHLLVASCAHRLQDRAGRDEQLRKVFELTRRGGAALAAEEGAHLLAAEWALDDRDAARALALLADLPPGVARRTQALRLRLQAQRLACRPEEALHTLRLLAHHHGFPAEAARGLVRSLVCEALDAARDAGQVRALWQQLLDPAERGDPCIAAPVARAAARLGAVGDARRWLGPLWERLPDFTNVERRLLAEALVAAIDDIPADWVARLEALLQPLPEDGAVAYALGCALAEHGLWEKAQSPLQRAAEDEALSAALRCRAWHLLARLAERQGDALRAAHCHEAAGRVAWSVTATAC